MSVVVRRHEVAVRVVGHHRPTDNELERSLMETFPLKLAEAFDQVGTSDGYWLVRRVDAKAAASETGRVAGALAQTVAQGVAQQLASGTNPESLLWFSGRASFVGRFLVDIEAHRASGRWEYTQFGELAGDLAGALEWLARFEPDVLREALLGLSPVEIEAIVWAISPIEADSLLSSLAAGASYGDSQRGVVARALGSLDGSRRWPRGGRMGLLLALLAARETHLSLAATAGPAREIARLSDVYGPPLRLRIVEAFASGDWSGPASGLAGEAWAPLDAWSAEDREELERAWAPTPRPDAADADLFTRFGGALILLPQMDELWDWVEASGSWPPLADGTPPEGPVRLLVLAAALGGALAERPTHDSVLRFALGVPEEISDAVIFEWLAGIDDGFVVDFAAKASNRLARDSGEDVALGAEEGAGHRVVHRAATSLLRDFAARLPGMKAASAPYLRHNFLNFDAAVTIAADRITARLENPPMHLLLSMAGLNRGTFTIRSHGLAAEVSRTWVLTTQH